MVDFIVEVVVISYGVKIEVFKERYNLVNENISN